MTKMAALCELVSVGIIEKDSHNDVLWTWSYPTVLKEQKDVYLRKCCLKKDSKEIVPLVFGKYKGVWYYIYTFSTSEMTALKKVSAFSLVLASKDFNPEKYKTLAHILCRAYDKTANPASMLESYLAVITRGHCNGDENGTFNASDYDVRHAYVAASLKDVIQQFGIETILIYTALLLKKRIVVYHSKQDELLNFVRVLPALAWHRQNWSILYPLLDLVSEEISDLTTMSHYVAGSTDPSIENKTDLYDIFVSLSTNEITIAPHAKDSLAMGKIHKDIALFIMQCGEDEGKTEHQVIKDIAVRTKDLLANLRSLAVAGDEGRPVITLDMLKAKKLPAATENFLFNLASSEGLVAS